MWIYGAMMSACVILASVSHADRDVVVTVTVKQASGEPVQGLGLLVRSASGHSRMSTNTQGVASMSVKVPDLESRLVVRPIYYGEKASDLDASFLKFNDAKENLGIHDEYFVPVPLRQAEVLLNIVFPGAVKARGTVRREEGAEPDLIMVRIGGGPLSTFKQPGKVEELAGIPKGEACEIAIVSFSGPILVRKLGANETGADIDLGHISVPAIAGVTSLALSVDFNTGWPTGLDTVPKGVVVIKDDRSVMYEGGLSESGEMQSGLKGSRGVKPRLDEGVYYVGLGTFKSWINAELWRALKRPDAAAALKEAKWPTVTVPATGAVTKHIATAEVIAAARRLRGF